MFDGIITHTGKIHKIHKKYNNCIIEISSKMNFNKNEIGTSIACSGVCLTLENFNKKIAKFFLLKETLNRTIFKSSKRGDIINLEKPLEYGERISGHFVQGHVDTTSKVTKIYIIGKSRFINFGLSEKFQKLTVEKGSIAINGVSLTISKILKNGFEVVVIPKTLKFTNLINLKEKDLVNIEFDVLGKYINSSLKEIR